MSNISTTTTNEEKKYDSSKISTLQQYDKTLYKEVGVVCGIAAHGVSLSKSLFSSVRAVFGQRETNIENVYVDAFDNAILHMIENASKLTEKWDKIVGLISTLNSPNPETVTCMVQGTVLVKVNSSIPATTATNVQLKTNVFPTINRTKSNRVRPVPSKKK